MNYNLRLKNSNKLASEILIVRKVQYIYFEKELWKNLRQLQNGYEYIKINRYAIFLNILNLINYSAISTSRAKAKDDHLLFIYKLNKYIFFIISKQNSIQLIFYL